MPSGSERYDDTELVSDIKKHAWKIWLSSIVISYAAAAHCSQRYTDPSSHVLTWLGIEPEVRVSDTTYPGALAFISVVAVVGRQNGCLVQDFWPILWHAMG